jgi:carbonic anhydrase
MASSGSLVISESPPSCKTRLFVANLKAVSCNESDPRVDPSRYFNLSTNSTKVIKTAGGRSASAINDICSADQTSRIGMILIVQHTS